MAGRRTESFAPRRDGGAQVRWPGTAYVLAAVAAGTAGLVVACAPIYHPTPTQVAAGAPGLAGLALEDVKRAASPRTAGRRVHRMMISRDGGRSWHAVPAL